MITGIVAHRHALIHLSLLDRTGQEVEIETTLDTGFTGFLTLPPADIATLGLPFAQYHRATLADGSVGRLEVYAATVIWDGEERDIDVLAIGTESLLGMSLLEGSDVRLQVTDGGLVVIEPL